MHNTQSITRSELHHSRGRHLAERRTRLVVLVTMQREDSETVAEFERLVAQIPNVVQAQRLRRWVGEESLAVTLIGQ